MPIYDTIEFVANRVVRSYRCELRARWVAEIEGIPNKVLASNELELMQRVRNVVAAVEVARTGWVGIEGSVGRD